ncbi:MAG: hypothetical protein V4651_07625 [Bacteroidota bacterium]
MKVQVVFIVLLSVLYSSCGTPKKMEQPQPSGCTLFKNGVFKLMDKEAGTSYIIRNGDTQMEIAEGKTDTSVLAVNWINDCTYTLTPSKKILDEYPSLPKNAQMKITIIQTTDSSYVQTSTSNFSDMVITNEVIRMK